MLKPANNFEAFGVHWKNNMQHNNGHLISLYSSEHPQIQHRHTATDPSIGTISQLEHPTNRQGKTNQVPYIMPSLDHGAHPVALEHSMGPSDPPECRDTYDLGLACPHYRGLDINHNDMMTVLCSCLWPQFHPQSMDCSQH